MSTGFGGLADLHPNPGPGRGLCAASEDGPAPPAEDDGSVISLLPLTTFTGTRSDAVALHIGRTLPIHPAGFPGSANEKAKDDAVGVRPPLDRLACPHGLPQ